MTYSLAIAPPLGASTQAHLVDGLLRYGLLVTAILFGLATVYLVVVLVRQPKQASKPAKRPALIVLALCFLLAVALDLPLAIRSAQETASLLGQDQEAQMKVQVFARQWSWDFRLAGADQEFGTDDDVVTTNELHLPTKTRVALELASSDVVHSFFVPAFRIKMDVVPGRINRLGFEIKTPGQYEVACAEHCGMGHYKMRALIVALGQSDFQAWEKKANERSAMLKKAKSATWGWSLP